LKHRWTDVAPAANLLRLKAANSLRWKAVGLDAKPGAGRRRMGVKNSHRRHPKVVTHCRRPNVLHLRRRLFHHRHRLHHHARRHEQWRCLGISLAELWPMLSERVVSIS
jgi:hypothetical protein